MKLDGEQARLVREGLDDALKEQVEEGAELAEVIVLTDAFTVCGEFEAEAGPFFLTLTVEGEFAAEDPTEDGS